MTNKLKKQHMRVIAGRIKGKLVECPQGIIRPLTSKVKEALFSIIGNLEGMNMLDMFTGSGNIAIEAYSRGLEEADLVEFDINKKKTILKNLENAGFTKAQLFISDAISFCQRCKKQYDFIMLDPPFMWDKKEELLKIISQTKLLSKDGFIILHIQKKEVIPDSIENLIKYDIRNYGINVLHFYENMNI